MHKYNTDDLVDLTNWRYNFLKPIADMLAAVLLHDIGFVSNDCQTRDNYPAVGTVNTSAWKTLPLTAARFDCITLQTNNEGSRHSAGSGS